MIGVITIALLMIASFVLWIVRRRGSRCNVYVMAPLDVMGMDGELKDEDEIARRLACLKSADCDGIMLDVWWGIVEREPGVYGWNGYLRLFDLCRRIGLKIIPVMSFHKCGGNVGDTVNIDLPEFVTPTAPFFVDEFGHVDDEYISPGFDHEIVDGKRTPLEMYYDFMKSFAETFEEFLGREIEHVEVGLGPCGELRYPSYQMCYWTYPGAGTFQCFDVKMKERMKRELAVESPGSTGGYNATPKTSEFWRTGFAEPAAKAFIEWYNKQLLDHGREVLEQASKAFSNVALYGKLAGIHWWSMHPSRCAETTAGICSSYRSIAKMFAAFRTGMCFTCLEMTKNESMQSDPVALADEVLDAARDHQCAFSGENALECYDRHSFRRILSWCEKGMCEFTFLRLTDALLERKHWRTFRHFIAAAHSPRIRPFFWLTSLW